MENICCIVLYSGRLGDGFDGVGRDVAILLVLRMVVAAAVIVGVGVAVEFVELGELLLGGVEGGDVGAAGAFDAFMMVMVVMVLAGRASARFFGRRHYDGRQRGLLLDLVLADQRDGAAGGV